MFTQRPVFSLQQKFLLVLSCIVTEIILLYRYTNASIPLTAGSGVINACSHCVFLPCSKSATMPLTDEKQVLLYLGRIFFLPIWGSAENVLQGYISL